MKNLSTHSKYRIMLLHKIIFLLKIAILHNDVNHTVYTIALSHSRHASIRTTCLASPPFCGTLPAMPRFHLVSLFPEFFDSPLSTALMGRARETGVATFSFHDPRAFSTDTPPCGRQTLWRRPGMVTQGEPAAWPCVPSNVPRLMPLADARRPPVQPGSGARAGPRRRPHPGLRPL